MPRVQTGLSFLQQSGPVGLSHWTARTSFLALAIAFATPSAAQTVEGGAADEQTTPAADASQPEAAAPDAATGDEGQGNDVYVTARRVRERLQDIPASVSAITGDRVGQMTSLSDLQSMISGVTFKVYGPIPIVGMRGYGNRSVAGTALQSTVGIFQDGVFVSPPRIALASRVDTERVEVAKGPQSTLYGRSSFVGAINIVSNDPARELGGYVDAGIGGSSVDGELLWHIRGAVSIPLNDNLSVRFFGLREQRDGFTHDRVTDRRGGGYDRTIGRVRVLWEPSDVVTARLTGTIMRDNLPLGLVHSGRTPAPLGQAVLFGNPGNPAIPTALVFGRDVWDATYAANISGKTRAEQLTLDMRFQTPIGELASLSDFQHTFQDLRLSLDLTRLNIAQGNTPFNENRWSQELRLSNTVGRFSYLFGAYILHVEAAQAGGRAADLTHPTNTFGPGSVQYDLGARILYSYAPAYTESDAYAFFGQVGFDITDRLNLTVGLRQGHDELAGTTGAFATTRTGVFLTTTPLTYRSAEFDATTGSANLSYTFRPGVIAYASYSRGDSPGGLNTGGAALIPFGPQKVDAYEIGLRSQLLDRRLTLNVALFNNQYSDLQITQNVFINGANVGLITNAGAGRGYGFDIDAVAILSPNWRLGLQYTYANSKITEYTVPPPPAPQINLVGVPFVRSPRHSLNASLTFTQEIGRGRLQITAEETYSSSYTNDYQGSPAGFAYPGIPGVLPAGVTTTQVLALFRTPGYALTNLNASYTIGDWQISGYVRNLFNHQYIAGVLGFGTTIYPQELPGEPRTFEISVKFNF